MTEPHKDERTLSREFAVKYLYQFNLKELRDLKNQFLTGVDLSDELVEFIRSYAEQDQDHPNNDCSNKIINKAKKIITGVQANFEKLENLIAKTLQTRSIEKLDPIEHAVLLVATYELLDKLAPQTVVINEAINLTKKYGQGESYTFINGILDKISKEL